MRLEWSAFSFADRESIFDDIEADSPRAAIAVDDAISKIVEQLDRVQRVFVFFKMIEEMLDAAMQDRPDVAQSE